MRNRALTAQRRTRPAFLACTLAVALCFGAPGLLTKAACSEPDVSASGPAEPSTEKAQGAEAPKGKDLERPDPDSEVAPGEGSTPAGTGAEESSPSAE